MERIRADKISPAKIYLVLQRRQPFSESRQLHVSVVLGIPSGGLLHAPGQGRSTADKGRDLMLERIDYSRRQLAKSTVVAELRQPGYGRPQAGAAESQEAGGHTPGEALLRGGYAHSVLAVPV